MKYHYANRMQYVKPSAIRELLKLGSDPEIISFGGGFPDPDVFFLFLRQGSLSNHVTPLLIPSSC